MKKFTIKSFLFIPVLFIIIYFNIGYSQVELVPSSHPVYDFIKRMQLLEVIDDYNSSISPVSRAQIAGYLSEIKNKNIQLNSIDKNILKDLLIEFEYDISKTLKNSSSLLNKFTIQNIITDKKQKYIYGYSDSNATMFFDLTGNLSQRNSFGDTIGNNAITLGEIGARFRGTLFNSVGLYLRLSNGQKLIGEQKDIDMAIATNPKLKANTKFRYEKSNYDTYEGYLRYATKNEWFSIMAGKEELLTGFGYNDKLFFSNNSVPFSYLKLDLKYKSLHYYFLYGNLKGDSLGKDMSSKNIVSHRLNIDFSKRFRLGFFESIIISDSPFNFTFLNPISFLRSADYSSGENLPLNKNNALMGFDFEILLIKKLAFQSTLLIDDLNFSTIISNKKDGHVANDNRFGYQLGAIWTDAFYIPSLTASVEYTRLNPFVYTHRTNKSQYTNWTLPLGHNLSPNSDEITLRLNYYPLSRLNVKFTYQFQRSGNRILMNGDTLIENFGGYINRGDGDIVRDNTFLSGDRTNRHIFTFDLSWQPIRQYFIELKYQYKISDYLYASKKSNDSYFIATLRIDY